MRKRWVYSLLLVLLVACAPFQSLTQKGRLIGERVAPGTVRYTAYVGPVLVASSERPITDYQPRSSCQPVPVLANRDFPAGTVLAVRCAVGEGLTLTLETTGATSAQIVDGLRPVTLPVVVGALP